MKARDQGRTATRWALANWNSIEEAVRLTRKFCLNTPKRFKRILERTDVRLTGKTEEDIYISALVAIVKKREHNYPNGV